MVKIEADGFPSDYDGGVIIDALRHENRGKWKKIREFKNEIKFHMNEIRALHECLLDLQKEAQEHTSGVMMVKAVMHMRNYYLADYSAWFNQHYNDTSSLDNGV